MMYHRSTCLNSHKPEVTEGHCSPSSFCPLLSQMHVCSHRYAEQLTVASGTKGSQGEQTLGSSASSDINKLWPQTSCTEFPWTMQSNENVPLKPECVIKNLD